ncbi:glutamate ABC transporter substrate-binding protein [Streptomyces sp. NPDC088354]|uniref:glutamate ABC transporter substrate-binding protein n=1 Tax=unclassified Streptomyces TaxID=2593676 RepID=UPI0029BEC2C4|nr:glutamate ABC transporter substrate-binding protein [Streptomyces sp. MI02-7b]MDX3074561.1 glutamate ABC transporter substrate-binding protein [Streptomyces sp. MI02-7b]
MTRGGQGMRGWGGVAAMAGLCVLAVAGTALPLHFRAAERADAERAATITHSATPAGAEQAGRQAAADDCGGHPEASLLPSGESGPAVERIKQRGKLVVGVDQNGYRWSYRDPVSRKIIGFDIDLAKAIAQDILGDDDAIVYKTVPTAKRFEAVNNGDVDVLVRTVSITCERIKEKHIAFSTAYFEAGQQLLVPRQGSVIKGFDGSITGKRICTAQGTTGEAKLEEEKDRLRPRIVLVPNQLDCLVKLQLGEADAVFTDNALAAGQAAQDPAVRLVGKPVTTEYYGVAMNEKDTDLVRRVNKVLADYRSGGPDSRWMQAYRTWLEADLPGIEGPPEPLYRD